MRRRCFYAKSWFRAEKCPTESWSPDQAREAHGEGRLYTVLIDSADKPSCFLEIAQDFIGVGFLDERLRENLTYQFHESEGNKVFLRMATYREFYGDSDKVANGTTYIFQPNGKLVIRREKFLPEHSLEVAESQADVSKNYSMFPECGEYEDLLTVERM